ncbi:MAG TPA: tryptophan synthase subunit alpha [Armatimonadota bacterium]|nr:tryptophan synthase subunit alpha [Armatimonadota bacterium]
MSRIGQLFARLRTSGEGALICFVTAGDPDIDTTRRIVLELERAGADIVELGIPFSDPIADGASIQASSMRSLEAGTNVPAVLGLVRAIRRESELPLVLMSYYNPVQHYGVAGFAADCASAGVDGVIVTDLTPEESGEWKASADQAGVDTIFLLAPTSTDSRIGKVAGLASGFIYCVSRTGVTGARPEMAAGVRELVGRIRAGTETPIAVGFGISKAEHVREVCEYADGAVVGSLLVDLIAREAGGQTFFSQIRGLVSALKSGTTPEHFGT